MIRFIGCILLTIIQIECIATQDFKSIFHIPSRRNYDDLEILERSNFADSSTPSTTPSPAPDTPIRAYANAQVMLRFGGSGDKGKCACGEVCHCKNQPYYVPIMAPLPYCVCSPPYYYPPSTPPELAPPTPYYYMPEAPPPAVPAHNVVQKPELAPPMPNEPQNQDKTARNENVVDENDQPQNSEIKNDNHPQILKTVDLSEDTIKPPVENIDKVKCLQEVSNKLEPNELSPNLKIVSLDLDKVASKSSKKKLEECLLPYSLHQQKPKLLVSYPIFNKPSEVVVPVKPPVVQYSQSGYSMSGGSGYYADPMRTVIYRRPTVLSIVPPQTSLMTGGGGGRFIYVPVVHSAPMGSMTPYMPPMVPHMPPIVPHMPPIATHITPMATPMTSMTGTMPPLITAAPMAPMQHSEGCCCCSCAKYAGELNEKVQAR